MTKANELVDARINFISFVKKGANGDPLRILKSDDTGEGIDLASLNKSAEPDINIEVTLPKQDVKPAEDAPAVPEELIQKLNIMGIARTARSVSRNLRQGTNAGYRYARDPMGNRGRNLQTAVGHLIRSRAGAVGVTAGATAGRGVTVAANRIANARAAGKRVGAGLRAGYQYARASTVSRAAQLRASRTVLAAQRMGAGRASLRTGARAGIAVNAANSASRAARVAGRTWVDNARVAGGGFWRRVSGR